MIRCSCWGYLVHVFDCAGAAALPYSLSNSSAVNAGTAIREYRVIRLYIALSVTHEESSPGITM